MKTDKNFKLSKSVKRMLALMKNVNKQDWKHGFIQSQVQYESIKNRRSKPEGDE